MRNRGERKRKRGSKLEEEEEEEGEEIEEAAAPRRWARSLLPSLLPLARGGIFLFCFDNDDEKLMMSDEVARDRGGKK